MLSITGSKSKPPLTKQLLAGFSICSLILQLMVGISAPGAVLAVEAEQMCEVPADVALVLDVSGSMADGAAPSNCEWFQLDQVGPSFQCVEHSQTGLTAGQCAAKPAPTQCGDHPSLPVFTAATNAKIFDAKVAAKSFVDNLQTADQSALVAFSDGANLVKGL